ncbi:MAG: Asp-tRNA(Asn)/Glu-tRNA(Gln) amidotransferase subunit GatC [Candidatus Eisenbacteria bacterium]
MSIDEQEVARIAELARLEIPAGDKAKVAAQLSSVLEFVATLGQLDLSGCEPTAFAPAEAPLRADEPDSRRLTPELATAAAPECEAHFFLVPPIVENVNP